MERMLNRSETVLKSGGCGAERRARGVRDSVISINKDPGDACSLGHIINMNGKEGRTQD